MSRPTIVITGASRGIGAAIASIAAENGAQVVLTARSHAALEQQAQKIARLGGKALAIAGDVSRFEDCKNIIERTAQAFGGIDVLINNAAIMEPFGPIAETSPDQWSRHLNVNLLGPMMMCHLAIPYLRQSQGKVINITSGAADLPIPGGSAYCSAKAALNRFTSVLAIEEPTLTVLLFGPGQVDTAMQAEIRNKGKGKTTDKFYKFFVDLYEQGQLLTPDQSAQAAVKLALHAPHDWSGERFNWDDARLQTFS